jgi:hypothetical protein
VGVFDIALQGMRGASTYGPLSFQGYLHENHLPLQKTAGCISVDALERLNLELRDAGVMVFRLGVPTAETHTHFALARYERDWSDYFIQDDSLEPVRPELFIPTVSVRQLFAFQLLPRLTESSLVNLALASGLLHYALGVEDTQPQVVPATGQSTFSFTVRPISSSDRGWRHERGQVEIDSLFVAKRNRRECLFIIEAKSGRQTRTLSKHKLMYPLLALREHVPHYIDLVPVYLRVFSEAGSLHFLAVECRVESPLRTAPAIADLVVHSARHLVLPGYGSSEPRL